MNPPAATPALRLHRPAGLTTITHAAMATEFALHLGGHEPDYLRQAAAEAGREIDRLEAALSFYQESSDVTRFNRAPAGTDVMLGPDTLACLAIAAEAARLTDGAFDAFTGRAALAAKKQAVPAHLREAPAAGKDDVAGPVLRLGEGGATVRKLRAGPWLDLGALGKGYALDVVAALLAEWEITEGFLSAGGSSLRGLGGARWTVELSANRTLSLPGIFCLGASGFQFQSGHIIDARPAGPVGASATRAVAPPPTAALADALSTAAILLTSAAADRVVTATPGAALFVVDAQGNRRGHGEPFAAWTADQAAGPVGGTLLSIPCWGDGDRLAAWLPGLCAALVNAVPDVTVQVVDDGSPLEEQVRLREAIDRLRGTHDTLLPLIALEQNLGKGGAIRRGWESGPRAAWLAFVDADGAVPAAEVVALIQRATKSGSPALFIAERTVAPSKRVDRLWLRGVGSRWFNRWVRWCLKLSLPDTQCGLKIVPAAWQRGQPWREEGFAFDLELLLRAQGDAIPIITQPIDWQEKPGSTFGPAAMLGLFAAAWRLRSAVKRGKGRTVA